MECASEKRFFSCCGNGFQKVRLLDLPRVLCVSLSLASLLTSTREVCCGAISAFWDSELCQEAQFRPSLESPFL